MTYPLAQQMKILSFGNLEESGFHNSTDIF